MKVPIMFLGKEKDSYSPIISMKPYRNGQWIVPDLAILGRDFGK